jgi:hypothetical protein
MAMRLFAFILQAKFWRGIGRIIIASPVFQRLLS